jgi:hypothetical protein
MFCAVHRTKEDVGCGYSRESGKILGERVPALTVIEERAERLLFDGVVGGSLYGGQRSTRISRLRAEFLDQLPSDFLRAGDLIRAEVFGPTAVV